MFITISLVLAAAVVVVVVADQRVFDLVVRRPDLDVVVHPVVAVLGALVVLLEVLADPVRLALAGFGRALIQD